MRKTVTFILAATLAAAAMAGDDVRVYKFEFDGDNGPVSLELNSETMGFGFDELQPGDSRTTVTEDGRAITVSRDVDTIALDIAGQVFEIPARHGSPHGGHREMHHRLMMMAHGMDDGLTILSRKPLDETRRATIRDALSAAGIVDEIRFLSPGASANGDEIVIEKEIEGDGEGKRVVIKRIVTE